MGSEHDLHSDGQGICLPDGSRGLGQLQGLGVEGRNHAGGGHAVDVLQDTFNRYGTPEIVNTDQGSQFTAVEFVTAVRDRGCR